MNVSPPYSPPHSPTEPTELSGDQRPQTKDAGSVHSGTGTVSASYSETGSPRYAEPVYFEWNT